MAERDSGPFSRSDLATCGISVDQIPELRVCERIDFSKYENVQAIMGKKDTYTHDELFKDAVYFSGFIDVPYDVVFDYLSNVYSLEEWTASLRNFNYLGGGVYKAFDYIQDNTEIFMKFYANREAGVVDHYCAWDQGEDLFMRYHFRLLDGRTTVDRPGTFLMWFNARHPFYDHGYPAPKAVEEGRNRKDRVWVGDMFEYFLGAHKSEFGNMKRILETRFKKGHPLVREGVSALKELAKRNAK